MNFYRLQKNSRLHEFGDDIGEVPILGQSLRQVQNQTIAKFGFPLVDIKSENEVLEKTYFIFDEDLVFSKQFVAQALNCAKVKSSISLQFALNENSFNDRFCLPHSEKKMEKINFSFFYKSKEHAATELVVLEQKIYENRVSVPRQVIQSGYYHYDQCDTFIMQLISPFHLLHANLAFLFLRFIKLRTLLPDFIIKRWFPTHSKLFFLALKAKNKIGKNCKIHPTALLEGCEIGDNVTIGAYSVVRISKIGAGSTLEEHTLVKYSILGNDCYVSNGNQINACVAYDEVFLIHGPYQFSIFGKQSTVMAVINCDYRLDQKSIQIPTSIGFLDSKQPLLGVAYGHRAKIGGGNIILPGRIVPNDFRLGPPNIKRGSFEKLEILC